MPQNAILTSRDLHGLTQELVVADLFEGPIEFSAEPGDDHAMIVALHHAPVTVHLFQDGHWQPMASAAPAVHLSPAGGRRGWRWPSGAKLLRLSIDPDELQRFSAQELRLVGAESELDALTVLKDRKITRAAEMIVDVLRDGRPGQAVLFEALTRMLVVHVVRSYAIAQRTFGHSGIDPVLYTRILEHIDQHLSDTIRTTELADLAHMSDSALLRAVKSMTGQTPQDLVRARRVEAARRLLQSSSLNLSEIAAATGFADQAHFSRSFKRAYGQSPLHWRRHLRA
ncbi:MAG: AraC family transcriptional regulator [Pseudomonadota bacterium]